MLVADTIPLSRFNTVEYIVSLVSSAPVKEKHLKLSVFKDDTQVNDSVHGRYGDLNVSINAVVSGSDVQIQLTNGETFIVDVKLLRAIL